MLPRFYIILAIVLFIFDINLSITLSEFYTIYVIMFF